MPEAGIYTAEELDQCAGSHGDWIVEPVWPSKWCSSYWEYQKNGEE